MISKAPEPHPTSSRPRTSLRRPPVIGAAVLAGGMLAACNGVLGLDAPRLGPCADAPCLDATAPEADASSARDAGINPSDAGLDAFDAPDQGPVMGIRCGGGSSPALGCADDTPACCLVVEDGSASYMCDKSAATCTAGIPILCASNSDCSGSEVCCHFNSSIKCEGETVCASDSLVCDPAGLADQCPSGWTCTAKFTADGYTLPYFGCQSP